MSPPTPSSSPRLLGRGSWPEARRITEVLRQETVGGTILLVAAVAALVVANSPWATAYADLRDLRIGPAAWHLDLSLGAWSADGLLAIFFLMAGVELKREFVAGDLADRRKAALPIAAAACGVALPAVLYAVVVLTVGPDGAGELVRGWAIPTATDIAFALAVLAVVAPRMPAALRAFLLTLAVVDDLIAITIIALFYSDSVAPLWLLAAVVPLAAWRWLLTRRRVHPLALVLPAVLAWGFVHAAGVHATVAGVLLGLLVPVDRAAEDDPRSTSRAERLEHAIRPVSAGFAVPVFAFFAAGVPVLGDGLTTALRDAAAIGVVVGLVVGKAVGVAGGTWLVARFTRARLDDDLAWIDVIGMALLAGVGFTVSLLIGELAFGPGSPHDGPARIAVLTGSVIAALLASVVLRSRNRHYRRVAEHEAADRDADGVPDVYDE